MKSTTPKTINTSPSQEFWQGIRDELPLSLGVTPVGVVFGVLGIEVGLTPIQVMAMSLIIFGGLSQVIFAQMTAAGIAPPLVAGTVGIVNLRHALYSATMAHFLSKKYLKGVPMRWRVIIAYLLTDEAFFVSLNRMQNKPPSHNMHFHMVGTGMLLWTSWQCATAIGIVLGAIIPPYLNLDFALPLTFMAIILPTLTSLPPIMALITGGLVAILGQSLPWNSWIIAAALTGMVAGYVAEKTQKKASP